LSFAVRIQSNDECLWVDQKAPDGKLFFISKALKSEAFTWNAGIRDGDLLLQINNHDLPSAGMAQLILNKVNAGQYANYTIEHNGKIIHTKVYIKKLINISSLANAILALMQMLIGFIVLMAKPNGRVQNYFTESA